MTLPNLLIAGVTKAGTTSLFSYLAQHPDVCGSSVKETEFFSPLLYPDGSLPPRRDYERYFRHCGAQRFVLEATPNYWYGGARLLDATEELLGAPRYVVSLRDPVTRLWSEFTSMHSQALLPASMTVTEYVDRCVAARDDGSAFTPANRRYRSVATGFYAAHLPAWIDRLGARLRIVFFEDLAAGPSLVVRELLDWLGLDPAPAAGFDWEPRNVSGTVRSARLERVARRVTDSQPQLKRLLGGAYTRLNRGGRSDDALDEPTRQQLEALFAPANAALTAALSRAGYRDLPDWLRTT